MEKSYYAIIPANVRYDKNICPNAKLLYGEITALCNEKGFCWAGNEYFAELYGVTKKSVSKWINSLAENRYIKINMQYKTDSKEIEKRCITMCGINVPYPMEQMFPPYGTNVLPPMEQMFTDNNTVNNTINNTTKCKHQKIINSYHEKCPSFPRVIKLSESRKKTISARLNSGYTFEDFESLFEKAEQSKFLKGKNNRNWQADFDWLIKDANMAKVLEDKYEDKENEKPTPSKTKFNNYQENSELNDFEKQMLKKRMAVSE